MIKQKLINKRKEKNLTQAEFAFAIGLDTSNYNRRENGITKISKKEWNKMSKILETPLDEIYEPEDGIYIIKKENMSNVFSEFTFETMKKYIIKLEEENLFLKEQLRKIN